MRTTPRGKRQAGQGDRPEGQRRPGADGGAGAAARACRPSTREGQPFWWPEADAALFQSLRNWMSPHVQLVELDLHINDPAFAEAAAEMLLQYLVAQAARL